MPAVTFTHTKQAGTSSDIIVTLTGPSTYNFGPSSGSQTFNLIPGSQYTLSASSSGPGGAAFNSVTNSSSIGVDDRSGIANGYVYLDTSPYNGYEWGYVVTACDTGIDYVSTWYDLALGEQIVLYNATDIPPQWPITIGQYQYNINRFLFYFTFYRDIDVSDFCRQDYYSIDRYIFQQGADFDYDDFILSASSGFFTGTTYYAPYDTLSVTSFTANPNPQTSSTGNPDYTTTLSWNTTGGSGTFNYTINPGGYSGTTGSAGSLVVNNLPQSTVGSNSPSSITYTLIISDASSVPELLRQSTTSNLTVSAYNDNTYTLLNYPPSTTTTGRALNNLESNIVYTVILGTISNIDMPVQFTGSSTLEISNDGTLWTSGTILVSNGNTLYGRFTSLPFNTSRVQTGTNSSGLAIGSTNPQTLTFSLPYGNPPQGGIYNISTQTRAPVIQELFNAEGQTDVYPNPDIDTVPNPNTTQYISTGIDVTLNDAEIPVEIKTDNPDVQARINSSSWTNLGSIQ